MARHAPFSKHDAGLTGACANFFIFFFFLVWPHRETDEYKTLMTYIKNTEQGALRGKFITNIYNLQRKGEPERYQKT